MSPSISVPPCLCSLTRAESRTSLTWAAGSNTASETNVRLSSPPARVNHTDQRVHKGTNQKAQTPTNVSDLPKRLYQRINKNLTRAKPAMFDSRGMVTVNLQVNHQWLTTVWSIAGFFNGLQVFHQRDPAVTFSVALAPRVDQYNRMHGPLIPLWTRSNILSGNLHTHISLCL